MSDPVIVAAYRANMGYRGQPVTFRRVTGEAPIISTFDAIVTAIVKSYVPTSATGAFAHDADVSRGNRMVIVLSDDLADKRFPLPVVKNDKIFVGDNEFTVISVDANKRYPAGALEIEALGVS